MHKGEWWWGGGGGGKGGGQGPQMFHGMNVVRKIFSHAIQSNSNMTMGGKEIREK